MANEHFYRYTAHHFRFFVKSKRGDFKIAPNETFRFDYDMDDVNFSEIVVENADGEMRQIIANANPTLNQYIVPSETDFVIDDFGTLASVPANVKTVAVAGQQMGRMWLAYLVFAILLVVECLRMRYAGRKRAPRIAT